MSFENLDAFAVNYEIIADDITKSVDIDHIFEKVREFVRTTIFPNMLEFDFTDMRYVITPSDKMVTCVCFYTYTHDVLLEIRFPCNPVTLIKQIIDEIRKKTKTLFDSLTKEFIEYCKQNSDMDRDTKINKFIKEDKNEKID